MLYTINILQDMKCALCLLAAPHAPARGATFLRPAPPAPLRTSAAPAHPGRACWRNVPRLGVCACSEARRWPAEHPSLKSHTVVCIMVHQGIVCSTSEPALHPRLESSTVVCIMVYQGMVCSPARAGPWTSHLTGFPAMNVGMASPAWQWHLGEGVGVFGKHLFNGSNMLTYDWVCLQPPCQP